MDEIWDNEILIDVQTLNIDSASFTDIHNYAKQQAGEGASQEKIMEEVKKEMLLNVELQGKHRNRRTGSGGMLLGKVEKIGEPQGQNRPAGGRPHRYPRIAVTDPAAHR